MFESLLQHFVQKFIKKKPKVLVIVGPTASGKTSLGVHLAKKFNGEIISADSRQVYRGLDIGTGKVTTKEMEGVPHHLLDVADPKDTYTVANFVHDGDIAITDILSRNKLPIIVGGTFLYIDALLGKISTPEVPPNIPLRLELENDSLEILIKKLTALDPARAETIDIQNPRRIIRAIEIATTLGSVPALIPEEKFTTLTLGISISNEILQSNIHARLLSRLENGMVDEVRSLHAQGLSYEQLMGRGIEYKYISQYLTGAITREEMCTFIEVKSRQYAKRQMTWLKRDKKIVWIEPSQAEKIDEIIKHFILE